jgi:hypothetical protein
MLDAHLLLAIPPETHFIPKVAAECTESDDPAQCFVKTITSHPRWNSFSLDQNPFREAVMAIRPFDLTSALRLFYEQYGARFHKPRWGDKTPQYVLHMELIHQLLPEASFVHIIRDGRDVALSLKRVWFGPKTVGDAAVWWADAVRAGRDQGSRLPRYLEIRFEDLVRDTETALRGVCQFLRLSWDSAMLDYHKRAAERMQETNRPHWVPSISKTIHTAELAEMFHLTTKTPQASQVGRWKLEMTDNERRAFEAIAGDLLAALGYEV